MDTKFAVFTGLKFYYVNSLAEIAKTFSRRDLSGRDVQVQVLAGAVVVGTLDTAKLLDELYGPVLVPYAALDKNGRSIVTILATDPAHADAEVKRELNLNPSRTPYYERWVAAGRKLRMDDGTVVSRADYEDWLAETQGI